MDLSPILPVSGPFFRDIHGCQIQHFQKAVIRRKYRLAFSHFPELAIESLNSTYRKLNRQRSVFPSDTALLKALYLATFEATKKWTTTIRDWGQVYGELSIMYEGRLPE